MQRLRLTFASDEYAARDEVASDGTENLTGTETGRAIEAAWKSDLNILNMFVRGKEVYAWIYASYDVVLPLCCEVLKCELDMRPWWL